MRLENQGLTLWYCTPDAPGPEGVLPAGTELPVTAAVSPQDASNQIDVQYRVNAGAINHISADWFRNNHSGDAQYFTARLPAFAAGDEVDWWITARCAGRYVPAPSDVGIGMVSFKVEPTVARGSSDDHASRTTESVGLPTRITPALAHPPTSVSIGAEENISSDVERVATVVAPRTPQGPPNLDHLLATMPPNLALDSDERETVARISVDAPNRGPAFWKAVEEIALSAPKMTALRTTLALANLASDNTALVRVLQSRLPAEADGDLAPLATLSRSDWIAVVAEAHPDESLPAIARRAQSLSEAIEGQHPSLAFRTRLSADPLLDRRYPTRKVVNFLDAHADFNLKSTDVEPYLMERGLSQDTELKEAVLGAQRMLTLGATQPETLNLIRSGLSSADAIYAAGPERLRQALGNQVDDTRLNALYGNAQQIVTAALGVMSLAAPAFSGPTLPALAEPKISTQLLTRFPGLGTIFGDLSRRACSHCGSVLGPAAYLVDLLRGLDREMGAVELVLRGRRPDIAHLELSCANTNTEMPYVDYLLEVLEGAVTFPQAPILLTEDLQSQLQAGTVPEPVLKELTKTVSSVDGAVIVQEAPPWGRNEIFFVQGNKRWITEKWIDYAEMMLADQDGNFPNSFPISKADVQTIRDSLQSRSPSPDLIAQLTWNVQWERLPLISVDTTLFEGDLPRQPWDNVIKKGERFHMETLRQGAITIPPFELVGTLDFEHPDGTLIDRRVTPSHLLYMLIDGLQSGRLPEYLIDFLPEARYEVHPDPARTNRWLVQSTFTYEVRNYFDQLVPTSLTFSGSTGSGDLTAFAENRNPAAYAVLAAANFPWSLPFDLFTEEVRACLATLGVTRLDLFRALRPTIRNTSVTDAAEILQTTKGQLEQILSIPAVKPSRYWGLAETGNAIPEPSGDTSAPPIPGDWIGALSRLSVLLHRSGVPAQALFAALASKYVSGGIMPILFPGNEDRPSRVTLLGLSYEVLERLHRFLRLRRISGWASRDVDVVLQAVMEADGQLSGRGLQALAALSELATHLNVPLRQATMWLNRIDTATYVDREAPGEPALPSQYEEIFLQRRSGQEPDPDFALDEKHTELAYITTQIKAGKNPPELKTLTAKVPEISRALRSRPVDLSLLINTKPPQLDDQLTLANLTTLAQHFSYARVLGLAVRTYLMLNVLAGEALFPDPSKAAADERARRLLRFSDLVDDVHASGFSVDQLAEVVGAPTIEATAERERSLRRLQALIDLQAGLRAAASLPTGGSEVETRSVLAAAGWPPAAVERVVAGAKDNVGLTTVPDLRIPFLADTPPVIPATLPFRLEPGAAKRDFFITIDAAALAGKDAAAAFDGLAAVTGLGPLADPVSPAARVKAAWDNLRSQTLRLATWLQSIDLPTFRTRFAFNGPVPPALSDPQARLRYDPNSGNLVLHGYLDPPERPRFAALSGESGFAAAVETLAGEADAYVERRPGSQLVPVAAVLDLILRESAVPARFATVHEAAAGPARRRSLLMLVAESFGIDPLLLQTFDDAAQFANPPHDVLAPLCSPEFLSADLVNHSPKAAWMTVMDELFRVAAVVATLRVPSSERYWFTEGTGFTKLADLGFLPGTTSVRRFDAWHRTAVLYGLRESVPAKAATLEAIRAAVVEGASNLDEVLGILERAFQLPAASTQALGLDGLIKQPADLLDPLLLRSVIVAAQTLRRTGVTADVALSLCNDAPTESEARAARGMFAGKYGSRTASDGLRAAMNVLREQQRAALVDYLIHRDGAVDAADLHARYLLDVEMGPDMRTSRVKQAISSTQLFIQRWLMNLEPELPEPSSRFTQEWEWIRSYRVWEANRNVFLYPENWLEPNLRDDKTHLFQRFESALLQSEVTSERAVAALRDYLDGLEQISRVTVMAMYRETSGPRTGVVHLVGRTAYNPAKFFYRRWTSVGSAGSWEPWEPVDVISDADHIVIFVRNGRPTIAWLQIDDASPADLQGPVEGDASVMWALQVHWSERLEDGWSAPKKSPNKILHPKRINKPPSTTFALRLESAGASGPVIRCYGGTEGAGTTSAGPGPTPWTPSPKVLTADLSPNLSEVNHRVHVQVLGKLGNIYVSLPDAIVEMWAIIQFRIYPLLTDSDYGTSDKPKVLPNHDGFAFGSIPVNRIFQFVFPHPSKMSVNVRVRFGNAEPQMQTKTELSLAKENTIQFSFVFDVSKVTTGSVASKTDPNRRLRMFPLATADWGFGHALRWQRDDSQPSRELLPMGQAEHYSSGFRFPASTQVEVGGVRITGTGTPEKVFVCGSAVQNGDPIGLPYYVEAESAPSSGFVTHSGVDGSLIFLPATEVTHPVVQAALDRGTDSLQLPSGPPDPRIRDSVLLLQVDPGIAVPFNRQDAQFAAALPNAGCHWEVFFHVPIMVARALATHQRFAEALGWLHIIFDPTASEKDANGEPIWWRFPPFAAAGQGFAIDLLLLDLASGRLSPEQEAALQAQIDFSRQSPFRPFGIARSRIRAFQWMTVLEYLKVLIAWGDQQFRRDTIESINEATQLYLLAGELLGRRPTELPERQPWPHGQLTFAALQYEWDTFSNVSIEDLPFFKQLVQWIASLVGSGLGPGTDTFREAVLRLNALLSLRLSAFCVPTNKRLDDLRNLVEDRLFKIRHSQNIDGIERRLALFEPPIDPALLVRAVAAGLDVGTALNDAMAPLMPYRFSTALQLATDFCTEVKSLGSQLLGALEKRDAEDLARLRSTQELALLDLVGDVKRRQADEAEANLTTLRQSRTTAVQRYLHFQRLLGKEQIQVPGENEPVAAEMPQLRLAGSTSDRVDADLRGYGLTLEDADHLGWLTVGNTYTLLGGSFQIAASIANILPNISVNIGPWASVSFGGSNLGAAFSAVGQFFEMLSRNAAFQSSRSSIIAGHQRRYDDWVLQSNQAGKEIEHIDKQILAAEIRVDVAKREISQHDRQVSDSKAVNAFMREKFTATELYQWMVDRLAEVHSGAYQLAYDLARRAQRAFAFELGVTDPGIITFGSWDGLHRGLLAGERLSLDLKRLQSAYAERNKREFEITKRVSLNQLDPIALLRLQTTGRCEFAIPELVYDVDFPGHYFRRIKTVSVTLPCVVGPYTMVAGTLTLLENSLRASPIVPSGTNEPDFRRDVVPIQSVAISNATEETGMFELNFRDDRYLHFEGAGAISRWRFELPVEFRSFDYHTIADLVLQIRYTARDGGAPLKRDASARVRTVLATQNDEVLAAGESGALVRAVSLRHEFPGEWSRLFGPPPAQQPISIGLERFPFLASDWISADSKQRKLEIWKVSLYVRGEVEAGGSPVMLVKAPEAAYQGPDPQSPPIPWNMIDGTKGAALYEFSLENDDWTPVVVSQNQSPNWILKLPTSIPTLTDAVLAFWWRLSPAPKSSRQ
jgi:hypothetical protein